ncbi:MAG: SIS domain-containing protein [Capsulimonadaceae bacterium]|nr:SIS domain-containing protein [Capsulimonadaceae bacterium]
MILDDPEAIRAIDTAGGLEEMFSYPEQAARVLDFDRNAIIPDDWRISGLAFDSVVIVGLGTSFSAALAAAAAACPIARVPISVIGGAELPGYVGARSLVVLVSYSGQTQECIAAYGEAFRRGARVAIVTSGGELASVADGALHLVLPPDLRSEFALPSLYFGCFALLEVLQIIPPQPDAVSEALALLHRQRAWFAPETVVAENPTKVLASSLMGKLPVLYSSSPRLLPVVDHWRTRINAFAKRQAHSNLFPEMTHNELIGWRNALTQSGNWAVLAVRDRLDSAEESARMDAALDAVPVSVEIHEVFVDGASLLARIWTGLYFADVSSGFLAVASGEQPCAI